MKHRGIRFLTSERAGSYASLVVKCSSMALVSLMCLCKLAAGDNPDASTIGESTNCTVITSRRLNYDSQRRIAVFEGNVIVTDPEINIEANQMTVIFAEDNKVSTIEAVGKVVIKQADKKGLGKKAVYYVQEGKVVLSGNPRVQRKNDELSGETITFYRGSGRMVCEPNAVLTLYSTREVKNGELTKE